MSMTEQWCKTPAKVTEFLLNQMVYESLLDNVDVKFAEKLFKQTWRKTSQRHH